MHRQAVSAVLALVLWLPAAAGGQATLDAAMEELATYEFGQSRKRLITVADHVRGSFSKPEARQKLARRLAELLESDATADGKRFACRQLALIGTAAEVSSLARLLADDQLSSISRFALERIPAPEAGAALRDALSRLRGKHLIGVINSLGKRQDVEAVKALATLLNEPDETVARPAASALGKIGGGEAVKILAAARTSAAPPLRGVITDAYLNCADRLLIRKNDVAAAIYREVYASSEPAQLRAAALRGLVSAQGSRSLSLVLKALSGDDRVIQSAALRCIREIPLGDAEETFAAQLATLDARRQALLLNALAAREDAVGLTAARTVVRSEHETVRTAALRALGRLGGASTVSLLGAAATRSRDEEQKTARASLDRLKGAGVDAAMLARVKNPDAPDRAELIRSLAARRAATAVPALLKTARDMDSSVQVESAKALGVLGDEDILPPLLKLLRETPAEKTRTAAAESIGTICERADDKKLCRTLLLSRLDGAEPAERCALLSILPVAGGPPALRALRKHLQHEEDEVKDAAVRALGDWSDPAPIPTLLEVAQRDPDRERQALALRGFARLAGLPNERTPEESAKMYAAALAAAPGAATKKRVLKALGSVPHADALALAESSLAEESLHPEAATATIKIARSLQGIHREEALTALNRVRKISGDDELRAKARKAIKYIEEHGDYITAWKVSGPYTGNDLENEAFLDHVFPPEEPDAREVKWRRLKRNPKAKQPWQIDLGKAIGGKNRVGYLRTYIWSPRRRWVRMEIGSDDGVKAWLNGKVVHANNAWRSIEDGEDQVKVRLRKGWNLIMLKITQGGGDWGASLRLRTPAGKRIDGLKVRPERKDP